jgi:hypothetical protein
MFVIDNNGVLAYQGAIDDEPDAFADPKKSKNLESVHNKYLN